MTSKTITSMRLMAGSVLAAAILLLVPATSASAEDFIVDYDQARLLRLAEPAHNVIIGNPSIADITLQSSTLLVVTGKTFGTTNLIILDDQDRVILNQRLTVKQDELRVVGLQRGTAKESYNCSPKCEPILKIGDSTDHFGALAKSATAKMSLSNGNNSSQPGE